MIYTVSEMAKLLNVAPSTLRFYDREGLIPFVERSSGGTRIFTEKDYQWLKIISYLKSAGMSLKDIRRYIEMAVQGDKTIDQRLEMFVEQQKKLRRQLQNLQRALDIVEFQCWYYETAKNKGGTDFPDQIPDEELPERLRSVRRQLKECPDKLL